MNEVLVKNGESIELKFGDKIAFRGIVCFKFENSSLPNKACNHNHGFRGCHGMDDSPHKCRLVLYNL